MRVGETASLLCLPHQQGLCCTQGGCLLLDTSPGLQARAGAGGGCTSSKLLFLGQRGLRRRRVGGAGSPQQLAGPLPALEGWRSLCFPCCPSRSGRSTLPGLIIFAEFLNYLCLSPWAPSLSSGLPVTMGCTSLLLFFMYSRV